MVSRLLGSIDVPLLTECDDEHWTHGESGTAPRQPLGKPSKLSFYNSFIRLARILAYATRTIVRMLPFKVTTVTDSDIRRHLHTVRHPQIAHPGGRWQPAATHSRRARLLAKPVGRLRARPPYVPPPPPQRMQLTPISTQSNGTLTAKTTCSCASPRTSTRTSTRCRCACTARSSSRTTSPRSPSRR